MNLKPCRACPFADRPCKIRDAMKEAMRAVTWPADTKPTNLNFRCFRRDEGFGVGQRVRVRSNVCRGYDGEDFEVWSGTGVIVAVPREVNGRWLVYFDRDPDWPPEKPAGRFHRDRLELLGQTERVCSCGNPARTRPSMGLYMGACDCPGHLEFVRHRKRELRDFQVIRAGQARPVAVGRMGVFVDLIRSEI